MQGFTPRREGGAGILCLQIMMSYLYGMAGGVNTNLGKLQKSIGFNPRTCQKKLHAPDLKGCLLFRTLPSKKKPYMNLDDFVWPIGGKGIHQGCINPKGLDTPLVTGIQTFSLSGQLEQLYEATLIYSAPLTCQAKNDFLSSLFASCSSAQLAKN